MTLSNSTASILGSTIKIKGELHGSEDIQISGHIEGEIQFSGNTVTISRSAKIDAGIHARRIEVEGTVNGNLEGSDEVVIRKTGRVEGNLKAPRVTLEDGATFRGSVDMRASASTSASNDKASDKGNQTPAEAGQKSPGGQAAGAASGSPTGGSSGSSSSGSPGGVRTA